MVKRQNTCPESFLLSGLRVAHERRTERTDNLDVVFDETLIALTSLSGKDSSFCFPVADGIGNRITRIHRRRRQHQKQNRR